MDHDRDGGGMPRSRSMRMLEGGNDEDGIDAFEAAANRSPNARDMVIDDTPQHEQLAFLGQIPKWPLKSHIIAAVIAVLLIGVCLALSIPVLVIYTNERACTDINSQLAKFINVDVEYGSGVSNLTTTMLNVIANVKVAADIMNTIYLRQVWEENPTVQSFLQQVNRCGGNTLQYFNLNFGPWDRMNNDQVFLADIPDVIIPEPKPAGANFYPSDMSIDEFQTWVSTLSTDLQKQAMSPYQLVRRVNKQLTLQPYSIEYATYLSNASFYLNQASDLLSYQNIELQLRSYLASRATDLLDNDYTQSDADYLLIDDTTSIMDIVVGPYEPREDQLLGLKFAYEAYVCVMDPVYSSRVQKFPQFLQELQNNLPVDPAIKQATIGPVKLRVVDQIFSGGIATETISSRAYGQPMDPVLFQQAGGKRVLLKNIQKAKYDNIMVPLSAEITFKFQLPFLSFDAYFFFVLQKELMHGLGPQTAPDSQGNQVNLQTLMGSYYFPLEEAKADIGSLWMTRYLIQNNKLDYGLILTPEQQDLYVNQKMAIPTITLRSIYVSFLVAQFRKVRYGLKTYESQSACLILSYLKQRGGVTIETSQEGGHDVVRYSINFSLIDPIVDDLLSTIMKIQYTADLTASANLLNTYNYQSLPSQFITTLSAVANIPTDIRPNYPPLA
jgi:hypothetical protein